MSGKIRAPRCSSGTRSAQRPRLPPASEGDAESRSPWRPSNGCGRKREVQSIRFLSDARHRAVVLGRGDDERVAREQAPLELLRARRNALRRLDVAVVGAARRSRASTRGRRSRRSLGDARRERGELAVERLGAERRREDEHLELWIRRRIGHACSICQSCEGWYRTKRRERPPPFRPQESPFWLGRFSHHWSIRTERLTKQGPMRSESTIAKAAADRAAIERWESEGGSPLD